MPDPRDHFRTGSSSLVSRADRRRQLVAFGAISGLVLAAFGLWFVAILTSTDRDQLEIAEGPSPAEERPPVEEEEDEEDAEEEGPDAPDDRSTGDEAAVEEPDRQTSDIPAEDRFGTEPAIDREADTDTDAEPDTDTEPDAEDDSESDTDPENGSDPETDDSSEAEPDSGSDDDTDADTGTGTDPENGSDPEGDDSSEAETDSGSDDDTDADADTDAEPEPDTDDGDDTENTDDTDVERVTIDGVCTVELDAAERDAAPLRAWEYADCTYAPVSLDGGGERWIVIRASMPSSDVDAAGAQERARDLGVGGGVLWSSHYPSLTPGLWVAYDGPFPDVEAARNAAEAVDGEAYPRALAADGGLR